MKIIRTVNGDADDEPRLTNGQCMTHATKVMLRQQHLPDYDKCGPSLLICWQLLLVRTTHKQIHGLNEIIAQRRQVLT